MKKSIIGFMLGIFLYIPIVQSSQLAASVKPSEEFVQTIGNDIISLIRSSKTMVQKKDHFRTLLRSHFDMTAIGQFVLGRYWRIANEKEKQEFLKLFEQNMVDTYTSQFDEYKDETMKVTGSREAEDGAIWVESQVKGSAREPLKVRWKLYKHGNDYRVYDIYVNEASMSITHRSEYATSIQKAGGRIQGLIDDLRKSQTTHEHDGEQKKA